MTASPRPSWVPDSPAWSVRLTPWLDLPKWRRRRPGRPSPRTGRTPRPGRRAPPPPPPVVPPVEPERRAGPRPVGAGTGDLPGGTGGAVAGPEREVEPRVADEGHGGRAQGHRGPVRRRGDGGHHPTSLSPGHPLRRGGGAGPEGVRTAPGAVLQSGPWPDSNRSPDSGTTLPVSTWRWSSPRPTTSSTRRSGGAWPAGTVPTPSGSSSPRPTTGPDSTATPTPPPCSARGRSGHLVRDPGPLLYAYRMTTAGGRATNGVIGALAVDPEGAADILPHEQTLPKAKTDRLDLLRATGANLSPIWGLSLTPGLTACSPPTPRRQLGHRRRRRGARAVGAGRRRRRRRGPGGGGGQPGRPGRRPPPVRDGPGLPAGAGRRRPAPAGGRPGHGPGGGAGGEQLEVGPVHRMLSGLPDGLDLVDAFASWFDVTRVGEPTERPWAPSANRGRWPW